MPADGTTAGVQVRQRWVARLMYPLLLPFFAVLIPLGVHERDAKEFFGGVVGVVVLAVLTYGAWHGRLLVEPDAIRKRWLRGWGRPMRFAEVTSVALSTSTTSGTSTMLMDTSFRTFTIHGEFYPLRPMSRALAPQLLARRNKIEIDDRVGTLRRAIAAAAEQ